LDTFEDRLLVWRLRRGSREALCRVYAKYLRLLLTVAANYHGDPGTAQDVVQDVFVSLARSACALPRTTCLKAYLVTCTANRCRDLLRQQIRRNVLAMDDADQIVCGLDGPVHLAESSEISSRLQAALAQLPAEQRETIVMHLHADMSFRAIAAATEVSLRTAQSRYRYGLDRLRTLLDGHVEP
jgi:RNA polymerase sigma factor (sigma-70 family)